MKEQTERVLRYLTRNVGQENPSKRIGEKRIEHVRRHCEVDYLHEQSTQFGAKVFRISEFMTNSKDFIIDGRKTIIIGGKKKRVLNKEFVPDMMRCFFVMKQRGKFIPLMHREKGAAAEQSVMISESGHSFDPKAMGRITHILNNWTKTVS